MNLIRRVSGTAVALAAAALVLGACGSDVEPRAVPESGSETTSASASDTRTTTGRPTTTTSAPTSPGSSGLDIDVEIGDCVRLGGTVDDATIENATCGSMDSNYKVIDIVDSSEQCVSDADQTYYESSGGVEVGALCLDVDWVVGSCMDISGEDPQRVDCAAPGPETEKVTEILQNTDNVNDCSVSEGGFVYSERRFVVCTDTL
ncbi:hypothetical protein [Rhodococcus ruber]|uniref:Lipoprotein n=1 Tax=Rhodococcus ruber BKS 20-38 TaxID=1278076 RepID=M3A2G8_9NOCA|nr:hypothetical protein [Rhodococcus ruber]EME66699.1 hypothetical protein G352_03831 [Rhodococcus ruber BKS 20-38]